MQETSKRVGRKRILAVLIGVALVPLLFAALLYWNQSYVHGVEACVKCGCERVVDRRGPFWFYSRVHFVGGAADTPREVECAAHEWEQVGCWQIDGGYALCGPPRYARR